MAKGMQLKLENLKLLDFGKIGVAFNKALKRCVDDCQERNHDERPRKVAINFTLVPTPEGDTVKVSCEIQASTPTLKTKVYEMVPKHDGTLAFNPDLPDDPDEETLYDRDERRQDGAK